MQEFKIVEERRESGSEWKGYVIGCSRATEDTEMHTHILFNLHIPQAIGLNENIRKISVRKVLPKDFDGAYKEELYLPQFKQKEVLEDVNEVILQKGKNQRAINGLLDYVISHFKIRLIDDKFWYYDEPIWKPLDSDKKLNQITYGKLECHNSLDSKQFREMFNALEGRRNQMKNINSSKDKNSYLVCFKNGVYDIIHDKMLPHSAEYYFFSYLNYTFIPGEEGRGEVFDKYLDSLSNGNCAIKERVLQIIGYSCSDMPNIKKIPLFVGARDSGKTTLTRIIHSIVGEENSMAVSLEHVNRFSAVNMHGKKIGICSDLSGKKLSSAAVEELKLLTGGDVVRGERKGKDAFSFIPTCKILIASNFKPKLAEHDAALEERWVIVPFRSSITQNEKNPKLLEEIVNEEVMQHVFYLVFEALRTFIDNGLCFTSIGELEDYDPDDPSYSVSMFFNEKCVYKKGEKLKKSVGYEYYLKYCEENRLEAVMWKIFSKKFANVAESNGYREDTNKVRGYKNLCVL